MLLNGAITALPQGQDHWLGESFGLETTGEERRVDEREGPTLCASKADHLPEAGVASPS